MNDNNLEERKRACECDVNELLKKERQFMNGFNADSPVKYVFCERHGLWVPFEFTEAR